MFIHRAVLKNQALAQRRSLYELLSIIAYLVAASLCLFSALNWTGHTRFILFCTAIWALFSLCVVVRLWWTNPANKPDRVLEFPENWEDSATFPETASALPLSGESLHASPDTASSTLAMSRLVEAIQRSQNGADVVAASLPDSSASNAQGYTRRPDAASVRLGPRSSLDIIRAKARAAQLKGYKLARLLRYEQKRSTMLPANSNLGAYLEKVSQHNLSA